MSYDDGYDSDTDTESYNKAICNELGKEIVELTSKISLKQKRIEELEISQKRMASMKQQYEKRLMELNNRKMSCTLKVNGITYRTTEQDLERIFNTRCKIEEIHIPKDEVSGKSKGFAFVR